MRLLFGLAIVIALGALGLVVAGLVQAARDRAALAAVVTGAAPDPRVDLPPAVAAFARRGLAGAEAPAAGATLTQEVEMILREGAPWQPMNAAQAISAGRPAFAWVARVPAGPVPRFTVIDRYDPSGGGLLAVRLLGAVRIMRQDGPATDLGEAMRYLAELPWAPDAILGNPALDWEALDGDRVRVSMETGSGRATVELIFDGAGDIVAMEAERPDPQSATPRIWVGRFGDYGEIGGRRVPLSGEVGYRTEGVTAPYWRGRITGYATVNG
ncbi:DUF6544 family protein [Histidinibacterium lentulum]|uniref:Uncharacterized protein n=1 Tax=Histidinibacterium lentulum TaxID=2480588 RepID=A0A3N2R4W0_9RHOB|nr:DUF6544 family protein [Histidinibacterium lentulum]ROU02464.1 hypothetical protein EAT49_08980 [Histidinibacterium lentulum]